MDEKASKIAMHVLENHRSLIYIDLNGIQFPNLLIKGNDINHYHFSKYLDLLSRKEDENSKLEELKKVFDKNGLRFRISDIAQCEIPLLSKNYIFSGYDSKTTLFIVCQLMKCGKPTLRFIQL